jgi:2-haloacid dehalogenase
MSQFTAISFDCYGTLIDWETGIRDAFAVLLVDAPGRYSDAQLLERFALHESELEAATPILPYSEILAEVALRVGAELGVEVTADMAAGFAASIGTWPLFDDVLPALTKLHENHVLAILSNVDRKSFAATEPRFNNSIDIVCIAEDIGAYKPSPEAFRALSAELASRNIDSHHHLHVAQSLYHDHEPAQRLGISTCWVDRRHNKDGWGAVPSPTTEITPDFQINDLHQLIDCINRQR